MMKRLIPTFNRILVQRVIQPAKTESGILLPEKASKLNSGRVIAVGPGSRDKDGKLIPVSVKEGDTVLLPEYGGTQVKLGEKDITMSGSSVVRENRMAITAAYVRIELKIVVSLGMDAGTISSGMRTSWGRCTKIEKG
uniref:Protein groES n=1 Tax=Brassica campestris TaxID=3711 RepID=M4EBL4_BRACM|nr:unnamed protein product [Brassica rapa]